MVLTHHHQQLWTFNCDRQNIPNKSMKRQESPPAWTQEAYRPLCSKYSLCCPNWVPPGGVPGTPPSTPPVPPLGGTRYPPGYPPGGVPGGVSGTPPGGVPGPPPGVDRQTKWNYYLPVVLRTRAVKIETTWMAPDIWGHFQVTASFYYLLSSELGKFPLNQYSFKQNRINYIFAEYAPMWMCISLKILVPIKQRLNDKSI